MLLPEVEEAGLPDRVVHNPRVVICAAILIVWLVARCSAPFELLGDDLDRSLRAAAHDLPCDVGALVALSNQLLADPPDDGRLLRALAALERAVAMEPGYRTRWRAARAAAYVAQWHSARAVRLSAVQRGVEHARTAQDAAPDRVAGTYFLAVNFALLARLEPEASLSRLEEVVRLAERARELDAAFQQGGPLRVLGAVYASAPPWPTSVGDIEEAEELLGELVDRFGDYPLNHFFLGETLMKLSAYDRAEAAFRAVLRGPPSHVWRLEGPYYRRLSRQRLIDIRRFRSLRRGGP